MFVDDGTRASPDNQGPDYQGSDNWGPDNQGLTVNGGILHKKAN